MSERRNNSLEKITLIQALIRTHEWRRGIITSNIVKAEVGQECADCAQFRSALLTITICGNAKCETDSIWSSGSVKLTVGCDLIIEGQVKHLNLNVSCAGSVTIAEEAVVSQRQWAKVSY
ncbi:unnamed protein product [Gongylonema pulchrum]|uniref:Polymer-forming cytoskeletal protein n=1 Tax=Gongylonema pulchrum TaxID=637853 RepID=A0A183DB91_9BILA|nr:unnamed protein product [Gongylonema pulchrum]